jgi:two-component system, cell cycle response regulator
MKARILVIEDSRAQAEKIVQMLESSGYTAIWASGGIAGLRLAKSEMPDLVLLDVVMEDMDGHAVCRWLKVHEATSTIPVIMLTVKSNVIDRVEGLNVGADDYLPKPFNQQELEARIYAALRRRMQREELQKRNSELEEMLYRVEYMAMTDPLTGLYNRRRFNDVLKREFATTWRYQNELSCVMIDIDKFKAINDKYGHPVGDLVLKSIAGVLTESLREVDVATRYGGEEFALIMPHTSKRDAIVATNRIMEKIRAAEVIAGDEVVRFTVSMGIADMNDVDTNDMDDLIRAADLALYEAKRLGRNQTVAYTKEILLNSEFPT